MSAPDWLLSAISEAEKGLVTTCHQSPKPELVTTSKAETLVNTGLAGFVTTVTTVTTEKQSPVGIFSEKTISVVGAPGDALPRYTDAAESEPARNDDNVRSFGWLIHYADREAMRASFSPPATHGEVLKAYPDAVAAEPATTVNDSLPALSGREESALQKWLASIGETDAPTIAETLRKCRTDADARSYFLARAGVLRSNELADDRSRCTECRNYTYGDTCTIARPGGIVSAMTGYRPAGATMLQRCNGYEAKPMKGMQND